MSLSVDRLQLVAFTANRVPPDPTEVLKGAKLISSGFMPAVDFVAGRQAIASVGSNTVTVMISSTRVDISVNHKEGLPVTGSPVPAGDLDPLIAEYISSLLKATAGAIVLRLAIITENIVAVGSPEEGVALIKTIATDLPVPEGATDLSFQTGKRFNMESVEDEQCQVLLRWNSARLALNGNPEISGGPALVNRNIDVSTLGNIPLRPRDLVPAMTELAIWVSKLLTKNFRAFG